MDEISIGAAEGAPAIRSAAADTDDALLAAITAAVLAVPGVATLEPRLGLNGLGLLPASSSNGGIRLRRRGEFFHVQVSISTDATRSARAVTHDVRDGVGTTLATHGRACGAIDISVLAITATQVS